MTGPTRIVAAAVAAIVAGALAGCTSTTAPQAGAFLNSPTALAVFRGVTTKSGRDDTSSIYPYRPYIAIANAGSNDVSIIDGVDDTLVLAPVPLRGLVYPVPGRPVLLAAADLGDRNPDLLVVVTTGDLPTNGGSHLEVIRTWAQDGAVVGSVDLGADILALAPLDAVSPGVVQLAAALAGERIAVVTFRRSTVGDGTGIDPTDATTVVSAPLGFQPVDLAVIKGDRTRVFAASTDPLPGGIHGVAEISLSGATPAFSRALNAHAPTRLVGAARLAESDELRDLSSPVAAAIDQAAFTDATTSLPRPTVDRVYAVLDESGCGLQWPIACGLVAIDAGVGGTADLLFDPTPGTTTFLAPIPIVGSQAIATSLPPQVQPPDALEPVYAGTYLRIAVTLGSRQATAVAGVASADGLLTFVDLSRWDIPSEQSVHENVKATVTSTRPVGTAGTQWLVLEGPGGATVGHLDAAGLTTSVTVTPGYTPTDTWTVTREGILPNLQLRRAEPGLDGTGTPSLALQQTPTGGGPVQGAVRLWDPTFGVTAGDTVVIDPVGLGTCGEFEATVTELVAPDASHPGGYVRVGHRTFSGTPTVTAATLAAWNGCVDHIPTAGSPSAEPFFAATFRARDYVLVRGTGAAAVHVGRPDVGKPFEVSWEDETALASTCLLPPAAAWVAGGVPSCAPGSPCRDACDRLLRVRLARRISYVPEVPAQLVGPALAFTLALEQPSLAVPRDATLVMSTFDGKVPYRVGVSIGAPVDPRAVVPFDRSPWSSASGIRFLVPYAGGIVLDGTPTLPAPQATSTIR